MSTVKGARLFEMVEPKYAPAQLDKNVAKVLVESGALRSSGMLLMSQSDSVFPGADREDLGGVVAGCHRIRCCRARQCGRINDGKGWRPGLYGFGLGFATAVEPMGELNLGLEVALEEWSGVVDEFVTFLLVCSSALSEILFSFNAVNAFGSGSGVESILESKGFRGCDGVGEVNDKFVDMLGDGNVREEKVGWPVKPSGRVVRWVSSAGCEDGKNAADAGCIGGQE
ncbi:hypothetical protein BDN67DRAFT_985609 [Paxillus ammoniavirescens]|nr:hypothetical protein BDN67DRAFT_985609 [Paxillus ammoniavirescens]